MLLYMEKNDLNRTFATAQFCSRQTNFYKQEKLNTVSRIPEYFSGMTSKIEALCHVCFCVSSSLFKSQISPIVSLSS